MHLSPTSKLGYLSFNNQPALAKRTFQIMENGQDGQWFSRKSYLTLPLPRHPSLSTTELARNQKDVNTKPVMT